MGEIGYKQTPSERVHNTSHESQGTGRKIRGSGGRNGVGVGISEGAEGAEIVRKGEEKGEKE